MFDRSRLVVESRSPRELPRRLSWALKRAGVRPTRDVLVVSVAAQQMMVFRRASRASSPPLYLQTRRFRVSTSRKGAGQVEGSNQTPLGLHRIARKHGGGQPIGTVFQSRQPVGLLWEGRPGAAICHRILWLEGLEDGWNRGGNVDTFRRYIYIHGFGDESTIGRPASIGCIHVSASDLLPLFDRTPVGAVVWITP
ncbi:MAG: L,D-transpeptidase [Verrucomicrobia bacterium]|nr:L,D-transpeptidase [Verrucomicrobiota bacterium]MBI3867121.1 L,D-transpeptidase [Verrucomicrobiota bacterium]